MTWHPDIPEEYRNQIVTGDARELAKRLPDESVDLIVTSPPYDDLRNYKGYKFDFKKIAQQLWRIVSVGGVLVWVVGDQTIDGSETGNSFKQVIYFQGLGFNIHDTMIYEKDGSPYPGINVYNQTFEYMFILSKGKPKTINLIKDRKNKFRGKNRSSFRQKDGQTIWREKTTPEYGARNNIWRIASGYMKTTKDKMAYEHPAMFPEALVRDHIISWSATGDIVLDPMCGAGTTCKMAKQLGRDYIGFEISDEYADLARRRVQETQPPLPGINEAIQQAEMFDSGEELSYNDGK